MQLLEINVTGIDIVYIGIGFAAYIFIWLVLISDGTNQKKHLKNESEIIDLLKSINDKLNK